MIILKQGIRKLLDTNLKQPYAEWSDNVDYKLDAMIIHKNHIYRSIVPSSKGVDPSKNTGKWLLMGVDNAYAAIDLHSTTASYMDKGLDHIMYKFGVAGFDMLALGGVLGESVTIEQYNATNVKIKTDTHKTGYARTCADTWYKYFYCKVPDHANLGVTRGVDIIQDPIMPDAAYVIVNVKKNSKDQASVASMVGGSGVDIGDTQFGVTGELIDYSDRITDDYGITELKHREAQEIMNCTIEIPSKHTQAVKREIRERLGHALMFIADPLADTNYEHLIMLGYIDRFNYSIPNGVITWGNLKIREVL